MNANMVHHTPEDWQTWISQLPLLNIGKACSLIQNALYEISRNPPADAQLWLTTLELFRPPVTVIQHSITENYLAAATLPLNKKIAISGMVRALQNALIEAYSHFIYYCIEQPAALPKELTAIAIHRTMNYLSESLLLSYQIYTFAPKDLWLKLHSLYQLAADLETLDYFTVHAIDSEQAIKTSIKTSYQRALLLALANCYQLNFQEMQTLYPILGEWALKTQLRNSPQDLYLVRLTLDEPPIYQNLAKDEDKNGHWLSLDISYLIAHIERLINHPEQNTLSQLSPSLLEHLLKNWGNLPARVFPRLKQNTSMKVCIGLSAVHYFLTLADTSKSDNWQPDFLLAKQTDENSAADTAMIKPGYIMYEWKIIDSSAVGYGLYCAAEQSEAIKVGEMIGIQPQAANLNPSFSLGVIRWIRITSENELLLGIQLLATAITPVRLRINDQSKPLRALLLPEAEAEQLPTLVTLDAPYELNTPLLMQHSGQEYSIELIRQINTGGRFKQFEFTIKGF